MFTKNIYCKIAHITHPLIFLLIDNAWSGRHWVFNCLLVCFCIVFLFYFFIYEKAGGSEYISMAGGFSQQPRIFGFCFVLGVWLNIL